MPPRDSRTVSDVRREKVARPQRPKPRPTSLALNDRVRHELPARQNIRTFIGQALANPTPDRDSEVRTLGPDGARALEEARVRLRRNIEATLVPRLEARGQQGEHRIRERPGYAGEEAAGYVAVPGGLKPLYKSETPRQQTAPEILADRAMQQLDPYVDQAAKYAGRPVRTARSVGRAFLPLTVAEKSLDPALVAFDFATMFPWFRGGRAVAAAADAGKGARGAAAREAYNAPGPVDRKVASAAAKVGAKFKGRGTRTFRVGDHEVRIPTASSRTGRVLESVADRLVTEGMQHRRAGRETRYSVEHQQRLRGAEMRELKRVGRKLNDEQEYALRVLAEGVVPEERVARHIEWATEGDEMRALYHGIHADLSERAGKYLEVGPDGRPVLRADAPEKLHRAWGLFQGIGDLRETLLRDLGRLSDEQIAARTHAPGRVYRGARYRSFEAEVRRRLEASPGRQEYFAALDALIPDVTLRNAEKALFDAAIRSAAERAGDPMAVDEILARLAEVRMGGAVPEGGLFQDDQMLHGATLEWAFRDYDPDALEEIATKYGLDSQQLGAYAAEHGERITGRVLSNREVWNEGHADYDVARGVQETLGQSGGHTWNADLTSFKGTSGFAVGVSADRGATFPVADFNEAAVTAFRKLNDDVFGADPSLKVGSWRDGDMVYLDISAVVDDARTALEIGRRENQLEVYDLGSKESLTLDQLATRVRPPGGWIPASGSNDPSALYGVLPDDAQRLIRQQREEDWRKLAPPRPERAQLRRLPGESDDDFASRQAAAEQDFLMRRQEWDAKYAQAPDTLPPDWLAQESPLFPGPIFRSAVEDAIRKMPAKFGAQELLGRLKSVGVKDEEIKWAALDSFLRGKKSVSRDEVVAWLDMRHLTLEENLRFAPREDVVPDLTGDHPDMARFGTYTLPGGQHYRELTIRLPEHEYGPLFIQTGHFPEQNVLVHVRFTERTVDGKRTLFIEEIQSDWHQQGQKRGYKRPVREHPDYEMRVRRLEEASEALERARAAFENPASTPDSVPQVQRSIDALEDLRPTYESDAALAPVFREHIEKLETLKAALREYDEARSLMQALERDAAAGVSDAPFRKTWHELAVKRMLAWAVENNYERVAWTTGKQQAERYQLANFFERVEIRPFQVKVSDEEVEDAFQRWMDYGAREDHLPPFPESRDFPDEAAYERAVEDYYEAERELFSDFRDDYIRDQQPHDPEDTFELRAWERGNDMSDDPDYEQSGSWDELDDYVGPDLAQKAREGQELFEGKDLVVGSHGKSAIGASKFYDDKLVGFVNKYLKRFKVGVETRPIGKREELRDFVLRDETGRLVHAHTDRTQLESYLEYLKAQPGYGRDARHRYVIEPRTLETHGPEGAAGQAVHSIEITPEVRAFVEAGQTLFQRGGDLDFVSPYGIKGAIEFTPQRRAIMHLFESADETTFPHELAHFIRRFALSEKEQKRIAKWAGARQGWTVEAEEKFARGVEALLRTGNGPEPVKQAFRSLSRVFREAYPGGYRDLAHVDLPDLPPHVAKLLESLFAYKRQRGGRLFGAEDVGVGVAYAPTWRGMPVKVTEAHKAMGAYIRRSVSLFGGGGRRAVTGAGPDDKSLRKSFTGSLLLSGMFRREVIGPKVESAMLANRMAAVPQAHKAMLQAGSPIPRDVTDIAVKIDPNIDTPDALKVFWDKIASVEGGQRKLGLRDLEDVNFELVEAVRGDLFPAQIGGRSTAEAALEILEAQEPIDNIVWVPQDFLDATGLLHVPGAARAQRAGLSKMLRRGLDASGLTWDALNDFQKALILYLNPAYVPMQLVGNLGMNLMQQGVFMPVNLWRSVFLHREMSSLARVRIDAVMGVGASSALQLRTTFGQFVQATVGNVANLAADLVPRRAAFLHEARKMGYRKGAEIEALLEAAATGNAQAMEALEFITRNAKRAIVDFDRLSPFERNVLARWIFFYPWLRGATDWSIHFISDHPMQAMGIALTAEHIRVAQEEQLGDRPHYAQLDVPISTSTLGLKVPGTDLSVGLDQLVGEHTWRDEQGNPMVTNLRQAFTGTTPFELAQIGIGFVTGKNKEAAADLVQTLTPVPYAAGVSLYGYDPFIGREVDPGLNRFFKEFGPAGMPLADRIRKLNMSPEERAKFQERSIHPRDYRHEWWRMFGGGLAPTPYNVKVGQKQALKHAPLIKKRIYELEQDSEEAGLGKPPAVVLEDLEWATKVDEAIERGDTWAERLEAVASVYDQRYPGRGMSKLAKSVRTEGEAKEVYEQLRPLLYPHYAEWNRQLDRILDERLEAEPVG